MRGVGGAAQRLERATRAFTEADTALLDRDAVEHLRELREGRRLFEEARRESPIRLIAGDDVIGRGRATASTRLRRSLPGLGRRCAPRWRRAEDEEDGEE